MRTILLVDGDEYLLKATAAVEREIRWDEWNHVLYANENEAWDNFTRMVGQLATTYGAAKADTVLAFGGSQPYFRHGLLPTYKGGRPGRKPLCYAALRERCSTEYPVRQYAAIEADDCLGILSTKPDANDGGRRTIICSQDKDMLTVPGFLHREGELVHITPHQAQYHHFYQTLVGDHVDNYPGCPGIGPKRAERLLADDQCWRQVVGAFEQKGLKESDALLQARLARILQWSDWDYERKQPILWQPSTS